MRKIATLLFSVLILTTMVQAQTLVTTQVTNKNAVLEEYTGIHCQYCPDGHAIAQSILDNNPGRAVAIMIHQGSYASPSAGEPDYRTPFGDALAGQTGLTGYPSGTVNRHVFSGTTTAMGRGDWTAASNVIMGQTSPVNVGIASEFDTITRQLTVNVELYYTSASTVSTNYINVALLQDHVFGPQTNGGAGNNYEHMHMLRYLVTGQWGDAVTPTAAGTLIEKTYTYTVPAAYNSVPCVPANCQIAVFVTESHQEILSGDVVDMIGGTNLYIGDITSTDSTMQLGAAAQTTTFNLTANSNLAGNKQFQFKLVTDAPADWDASVTIDGNTFSDSTLVNLVKGTPKDFTLDVIPGSTPGFFHYTFELTSISNPNAPVKYFTVYVISGVNTLLVNAAGDENAASHQDVYLSGLAAAGCEKLAVMKSSLFLEAQNQGILPEILNIFYNVAWTFPAFTDPEAVAVKNFVDQGGNLLVAGQDIGWDIMSGADGSHGTPEAQDLYTNYLKAHYVADGSSTNNKYIANPDDEIYGSVPAATVVDVNGGNMYPDQVTALQDAVPAFYYDVAKTKISALRSMKETSKVVYFGVGLEMVRPDSTRENIIGKTWDWFMEGVGIGEKTSSGALLSQNSPNPASDQTTVQVTLTKTTFCSIVLTDVAGKEVRTLFTNTLEAGTHPVTFSVSGLERGVYLYTLRTANGVDTKKITVVR